jgi:hypothetical protein
MLQLTPDQEKQICETLIELGWLETEHALHGEGVRAIQSVLQASSEDAIAILRDLRARKLIELEITPGGQWDARKPMPVTQWRWLQVTKKVV